MDFDPDSMTCVGTSREFTSLHDCQQAWSSTLPHTRADQQSISVRADIHISNVRADPQNCRDSPTIKIINNI